MTDDPKPKKPPYRPTRLCPHRLCRPLHDLVAVCALALIARDLFSGGLVFILFMAALIALALGVHRLVWKKPMTQLAMEDAVQGASATAHGSGGRVLIARKGWARAAVTFDLFFLFIMVDGVVHIAETRDYSVPAPTAETYVILALALSIMAGDAWCHRKATEPATPARAAVPVRVEGGA